MKGGRLRVYRLPAALLITLFSAAFLVEGCKSPLPSRLSLGSNRLTSRGKTSSKEQASNSGKISALGLNRARRSGYAKAGKKGKSTPFRRLADTFRERFKAEESSQQVGSDVMPRLDLSKIDPGEMTYTARELKAAGKYQALLIGHGSLTKRIDAIRQLVESPAPDAEPALTLVLGTRGDSLAPLALTALSHLPGKGPQKNILKSVSDSRPEVRQAAVIALADGGGRSSVKLITRCLRNDESGEVKATAALALGHMGVRSTVPDLVTAMKSGNPTLGLGAAWALYALGDDRGLGYAARLAASGDRNLSPKAIMVLAEMNNPSVVPVFLDALGSRWNGIWQAASKALVAFPGEGVGRTLTAVLLSGTNLGLTAPAESRRLALVILSRAATTPEALDEDKRLRPALTVLLESTAIAGSSSEQGALITAISDCPDPVALRAGFALLGNESPELQTYGDAVLRKLAGRTPFGEDLPAGDSEQAWRRWWIVNCRLEPGRMGEGFGLFLVGPFGHRSPAVTGLRLEGGMFIESVAKQGGRLILRYAGRRYQVSSAPVEK